MSKLHIVTAVHNRYKITESFIKDLKNQTYKNIHLILVDDGSTDGTDKMVLNEMQDATILYGDGNLWWGGAMHKAYRYIKENVIDNDFVLIMNDDTNFEKDFLRIGVDLLKQNENSLITACGYSSNSGDQIDGSINCDISSGETFLLNPSEYGNCASTRALFLTAKTFKKVGGFHPKLLPHYGSDYEFTIRANKKGFAIKSFVTLRYTYDETTTGDIDYSSLTLKKLFSKRSVYNPVYRFAFIFFVTPIKHLPSHLTKQIKRYLHKIQI